MDIEWLLLLCIPVVKVTYIVRLPTLSQKQMEIYPKGPTSKKCFFLHPFWMELTLSTDDTVLARS